MLGVCNDQGAQDNVGRGRERAEGNDMMRSLMAEASSG